MVITPSSPITEDPDHGGLVHHGSKPSDHSANKSMTISHDNKGWRYPLYMASLRLKHPNATIGISATSLVTSVEATAVNLKVHPLAAA